jgi:hypothetical protein
MTPTSLAGSYWDGRSRAFLRGGLGFIVAMNLVSAATSVWRDERGPWSHPLAPDWLLALGGSPLVWLLLAVGLLAILQFSRKSGQLTAGAVALLAMALLVEADGALNEGPRRHFFAPGIALFGWLAGLVFARALAWRSGRPPEALLAWSESHAEMGVVAALAGNYVNAAASKLLHVGPDWANDTTLRAVILTHHDLGDHSVAGWYAHTVAGHPALSQVLSVATLLVQGSACLMLLGPRWRLFAGLAVVGFHVNVQLLAGIGYGAAREVLVLFCLPWPHFMPVLLRRWPRAATLFAPVPPVALPPLTRARVAIVTALAIALFAAAVLMAQASPIRGYAALHHSYSGERSGPRN